MERERWSVIERLLHEALDHDPEERAAFLDRPVAQTRNSARK